MYATMINGYLCYKGQVGASDLLSICTVVSSYNTDSQYQECMHTKP